MVINYKKLLEYPGLPMPSIKDVRENNPIDMGCSEDFVLHESCLHCPFFQSTRPTFCGLSSENQKHLNNTLKMLLDKYPELFI